MDTRALSDLPKGKVEATGTYDAPRHGWTCFHCGETFRTIQAATEHFGPDPRWTPGCVQLAQIKPRKLWRRMRLAELAAARLPELEEQLDFLSDVSRENQELRNRIDSLEGALEVERLRLREAL